MRSLNLLALGLLFVALCIGNLMITADRSLIPRSLDAAVLHTEIKREKHPGLDDVHFLKLSDGQTLHVDKTLAEQLEVGMRIRKVAWQRELIAGEGKILLEYSNDFRGMLWAMPLCILVAFAAIIWPILWQFLSKETLQ